MLRKLLAIVLCWLALLPQSLCTCAAAFAPCCTPPASGPSAPQDHRCASGHRHRVAESLADGGHAARAPGDHPDHPGRSHEPSCAAVTGGQSATAPQLGVADVPAADVATLVEDLFPGAAFVPAPPLSCQCPPHVPLYLSLNVLRN